MQIIESTFPDLNYADEESRFKQELATDIINHFHPLFYEEYRKKHRVLKQNVVKMRNLQAVIKKLKTNLIAITDKTEIENVRNECLKLLLTLSEKDSDLKPSDYMAELTSSNLNQLESLKQRLYKLSEPTTN